MWMWIVLFSLECVARFRWQSIAQVEKMVRNRNLAADIVEGIESLAVSARSRTIWNSPSQVASD